MHDLILHHYASSPFSEKIRLILGFKGLAWKSVTVPVILPKPDVVALTGGYRRTPFLQIGADVAAMMGGMRRPTPADATAQLKVQLGWLERQLAGGRKFLCGDAACIADFSTAQSIWYTRRAPPVAAV